MCSSDLYLPINILKELDSDYIPKSQSRTGGGGKRILKFLVQDIGDVKLDIFNMRAWEGEQSSVKKCTFYIHVLKS